MDETTPVDNKVEEQTNAKQKPVSGNKNLILAVMALIVGAVVISAIFMISFPNETKTDSQTVTTENKQVTDITKSANLDAATTELDSANLDSYQSDLDSIDSQSSTF